HSLTKSQIGSIAKFQFEILKKRLVDQEIDLTLSAEVVDYLATTGYDPVYGARPLKRLIQQRVENPLAQAILSGEVGQGDVVEAVLVEQEGDKRIVFKTVKH